MGNSKTDWRKIIPGLLVSVIALAVLFYFVDLGEMLNALRHADLRMVALLFCVTLLWLMVRTMVWRTLLQEKATFSQVFLTLNEGYVLNNLLPFRLGEVGRAFLLAKKANLKFMEVLSTILIERAMDVAIAVGMLLSTLPFVIGASWALQAAIITGSLVLAGLATLYLAARNRQWVLGLFEKAARRWPALERVGSQQLNAFLNGLQVLTDGKRFLRAVAWILLNWGVAILQFHLLLSAFFPEAQVLWAAFTLSVMALGVAAPSSPGSVGVLEAAVVGALVLLGLNKDTALAAALTAHLTNYLITGVIGVYALARDGLTLSGVYKDVRNITPETNV